MPSGDAQGQLLGRASGRCGHRGPSLFVLPLLGARLSVFGVFPISIPIILLSLLFLFLPFPCSKAKGQCEVERGIRE